MMNQSNWPSHLLLLSAFILTDALLQWALPRLGVSYGPARFTFTLFLILRVGLFLLGWALQGRALAPLALPLSPHLIVYLSLNVLISILSVYAFIVEPLRITQTHLEIPVPGLSRRVRLVQLSDLHVEYTTQRERALPGVIERLQPDLIVMTGDYTSETFTNDPRTYQDLRHLVGQFHAPLGIYAVNGNSEEVYVMELLFENTNVQLLKDQALRLPELGTPVALLGLNFIDSDTDGENLKRLMAQARPEDYTILLYHKPDLAYIARDLKINLYLCGHTHGGQVRLPFYGALFTNSKYGKTFEMGPYTLDETTLFISRGLGFVSGMAPRLRFLAPPEVVVIDLIPAAPAN